MDYYKIITDRSALISFIDWLPDLGENERYYLSLFARKKYTPNLIKSNDKTQLKRFTSSKERMLTKIEQLEIPLNRWKLKDISAPQESLVLYIMPNPRCMKKATQAMGKKCWDLNRSDNFNLHQEAMSCIQRSKSYTKYVHFDLDVEHNTVDFNSILAKIGVPYAAYHILQTRGGYHLLIDPRLVPKQAGNWHKAIRDSFEGIDQHGDQMMPVPGTIQGGFTPKFIL